jgi:hypothetical protein
MWLAAGETFLNIYKSSQDNSSDRYLNSSDRMGQVQDSGFVTWIMNMLLVQLILFVRIVTAQDDFGGGEDAGADMDLESMMGGDSGGIDDKNPTLFKTVVEKTFMEETILALQQLGLIVGEYFCSKSIIFDLKW